MDFPVRHEEHILAWDLNVARRTSHQSAFDTTGAMVVTEGWSPEVRPRASLSGLICFVQEPDITVFGNVELPKHAELDKVTNGLSAAGVHVNLRVTVVEVCSKLNPLLHFLVALIVLSLANRQCKRVARLDLYLYVWDEKVGIWLAVLFLSRGKKMGSERAPRGTPPPGNPVHVLPLKARSLPEHAFIHPEVGSGVGSEGGSFGGLLEAWKCTKDGGPYPEGSVAH